MLLALMLAVLAQPGFSVSPGFVVAPAPKPATVPPTTPAAGRETNADQPAAGAPKSHPNGDPRIDFDRSSVPSEPEEEFEALLLDEQIRDAKGNAIRAASEPPEPLTLKVTPYGDVAHVVDVLKRDGATITIQEPTYIICEISPDRLDRLKPHGYLFAYKVVQHCQCPHFGTELCGHGTCHARGTPCCDECAGKGKQPAAMGCCGTDKNRDKPSDRNAAKTNRRMGLNPTVAATVEAWHALGPPFAGYSGFGTLDPATGNVLVRWHCRTGTTDVRPGLPSVAYVPQRTVPVGIMPSRYFAPPQLGGGCAGGQCGAPAYYRQPGFFGARYPR